VRRNEIGETTVSVAVPIQRGGTMRGALMLSTQGDAIDRVIASERFGLVQVFLVAALVMVVLSILLAGAIAGPVRRLADAAEMCAWASSRARRSRISPIAPTRSAISPARCGT